MGAMIYGESRYLYEISTTSSDTKRPIVRHFRNVVKHELDPGSSLGLDIEPMKCSNLFSFCNVVPSAMQDFLAEYPNLSIVTIIEVRC